jgi:ribosomal protein S12 methylthiotransferase
MKIKKQKVTVGFIALGCPKNSVDSERMLAEIAEAGFAITAKSENADVIIINTCGFIAPAKAESLEEIEHAVKLKLSGAVKKVIVTGCLPQREGKKLLSQVDGIDAIVGLGQRDNIARIIKKTFSNKKKSAYLSQPSQTIHDDRTRLLISPGHWAYLRISEGCNHRCSFCTIPEIRGRFRSKEPDLVLSEANELISAGAVELNIIAQDSTSYGRDLKIRNGLAGLINQLEKINGLSWIRLMYLYPTEIDDKLIDTIAESKKVVHYLDIPIQHVNNKILKAMRRPDSKKQLKRLIEKLRSVMPDIVLRTTLIVGFPGESDRQFLELLDFVKWAEFDALGSFKFYAESGTVAAEMPNQVADKIKQQRVEELMLT